MQQRALTFALSAALVLLSCHAPETADTAPGYSPAPNRSAALEPVRASGDSLRTGWYSNQPGLDPAFVLGGQFGQIFDTPVAGQIYAQPLIDNGSLLVVTEENFVYALDPVSGTVRQTRGPLHVPWSIPICSDLRPHIGITGTPVIDPSTHVAYFLAKTYADEQAMTGAAWWMHAVEVVTLAEQPGFPVRIAGTASNSPQGVTFDAAQQMQRPGLLLMDGVVYAAFGSHCDLFPWQGWVIGVPVTGGVVASLWTTAPSTPDQSTPWGAGIWQSGAGLVSDGPGTLLVATGNPGALPRGQVVRGNTPPDFIGEAVVRLRVQPDGGLASTDFFMPYDADVLDAEDGDLGSGGPVGLPEAHFGTTQFPRLLGIVGKNGYVYLLDRDNLGGHAMGTAGGDAVVSRYGPIGGVWSKPGLWPGSGGWLYVPTASGTGSVDVYGSGFFHALRYGLDGNGRPSLTEVTQTPDAFGFGSGQPIVTSDGMREGSALVWVVKTTNGDTGEGGELRAYSSTPGPGDWNAPLFSAPLGAASKFAPPGVGDGRLYVGTRGWVDRPDGGYTGHVFGFGLPTTQTLTASAVDLGKVLLGDAGTGIVVFTATQRVTINAITLPTSTPQFQLGQPMPGPLPQGLDAGQTLSVPITFTPTQAKFVGTTVTATTSAPAGQGKASVSGTGVAPEGTLSAVPPVVSFGGAVVGTTRTGSASFTNVGAGPVVIAAVRLPANPPFSATGAPNAGTTIGPGSSLIVNLAFSPVDAGVYVDELGLVSADGGVTTVALSGSAARAGYLLVLPAESFDLGPVAVGSNATVSFTLVNDGGTTLTFNKSKPPQTGSFVALTALPEGSALVPGASVVETVRFQPQDAGPDSAEWILNADDGTGIHHVAFRGVGVLVQSDGGVIDAGTTDAGTGGSGDAGVSGPDAGIGGSGGGGGGASTTSSSGCSASPGSTPAAWPPVLLVLLFSARARPRRP